MKKKPPYKKGDPVSVLYYDSQFGTCLSTSYVEAIYESCTNGYWEIRFTYPNGQKENATVDSRGRDRHGYVCRKIAS